MRKWLINFRIWKQTIYFPTNSCTRFTAWWGRGACLVSLFVAALWKHSFYPAGDCCCRDSSSAGSLAQFPWRRAEIRCTAFTGTCRIYYLFRGRSGHGAPQHKRCGAPGAGSAEGCGVGQETGASLLRGKAAELGPSSLDKRSLREHLINVCQHLKMGWQQDGPSSTWYQAIRQEGLQGDGKFHLTMRKNFFTVQMSTH